MSIIKKMFSVQGIKVKKDADNPFFKSKYQTLDGIMDVLLPLLQEEKLLITHHTENNDVVTSVIDVESEGVMKSSFPLPQLSDPQKIGSAITYAKRYNIGQLFNILTDEDDDGNKASEKTVKKTTGTSCLKCGATMKISQAGKPYCSALCWKNELSEPDLHEDYGDRDPS